MRYKNGHANTVKRQTCIWNEAEEIELRKTQTGCISSSCDAYLRNIRTLLCWDIFRHILGLSCGMPYHNTGNTNSWALRLIRRTLHSVWLMTTPNASDCLPMSTVWWPFRDKPDYSNMEMVRPHVETWNKIKREVIFIRFITHLKQF